MAVGVEAAVLAIAAALAMSAAGRTERLRLGGIGLVLSAATAWTALQLLPLPADLLKVVSPRSHALHVEGPLLGPSAWATLTIDRAATAGALAKEMALLALFMCVRHSWSPIELRSRRGPLRYVAIGSAVAALAALSHAVVGASSVFGLYTPIAQHGGLVSLPLVNVNHLAGLMNIGVLAALGLVLDEPQRETRWAWFAVAVFCGITVLLTLSRGGIAALILGCAVLLMRGGLGRAAVGRAVLALGAVVCSAGAFLALEPLRTKIATLFEVAHTAQADRFTLLHDATRMALAYPLTGSGRGSFVLGFPPFSAQTRTTGFTHPEVLPLQLACEWGIPFAALWLGILAATWITAARRKSSDAPRVAALAAVLAVGVQNLADFSLEIMAVALPALACLTIGAGSRRSHRQRAPRSLVVASLLVVAVAAVIAGTFSFRHGYETEGGRLLALVERRVARDRLVTDGRRMIRAHPADAYLPIQVARGLVRMEPSEALGFLNRALWIDPRSPAAQLLTGRALHRLGHEQQALLHYRAAAWDAKIAGAIASEAILLMRSPDAAIHFVPSGEGGLAVFRSLSQLYLNRAEGESALLLARELARRSHRSPSAMAFLARILVATGHFEEAIAAARGARGTDHECAAASAEAEALRLLGRLPAGAAVLNRATQRCPDDLGLREQLLAQAVERRDWPRAERALAAYRGVAEDTDPAVARGAFLEGALERARGRHAHAAAAYQRAADLAPDNPDYLREALGSWERIGRQDRVDAARRTLDQMGVTGR
jgi:tetratricopeptide (TPR) repeat protein